MTRPAPKIRVATTEGGKAAEIYVYDDIGQSSFFFDAFGAKDMKTALAETGDAENVTIRINSMGGDAYQAIAMHSLLRDSGKKITTVVDGIAASAASIVAMAGDTLEMRTGAQLMIHEPWSFAAGSVAEMEKTINQLKATTESAIDIYENKSGKSRESIAKMMRDETWLTAQEAKNEGFADAISTSHAMSMSVTPQMQTELQKRKIVIPKPALSLVTTQTPNRQPEKKETQMATTETPETTKTGQSEAPKMVTMTVDEYEKLRNKEPELSATELAVKAERERVAEIAAVCQMAGLSAEQQKKFVDEGTEISVVQKAALTHMSATNPPAKSGDQAETDENAAYRKEYQQAMADGVSMSCTENEYVNVRRVEDGKPKMSFEKKGE